MAKVNWHHERRGDWDVIHLTGTLGEDVAVVMAHLRDQLGPNCVFNFRKVDYVNSNGVRAWLLFLRDFVTTHKVVYEECPPVVVTQLNMIPGFLEHVGVQSVYVPYACQDCNHSVQVLVPAARFPKSEAEIQPITCAKCGGRANFLDTVDEYFEFVSRLTV